MNVAFLRWNKVVKLNLGKYFPLLNIALYKLSVILPNDRRVEHIYLQCLLYMTDKFLEIMLGKYTN